MRILIIASSVTGGATGIVSAALIKGLINNHCEVFAFYEKARNTDVPSFLQPVSQVIDYKPIRTSEFFTNLCILLLRYPLNEIRFINNFVADAKKIHEVNPFDVIMALSSASGLHIIEAARKFADRTSLPFYIHATDPMPAPPPWYNNQYLRKALILTARKPFGKADIISLSNRAMLVYQLSIMKLTKTKNFVALNPTKNEFIASSITTKNSIPVFLYVGSIYHQRKPHFLIKAFQKYVLSGQAADLVFLGHNQKLVLSDYEIEEKVKCHIKKMPFVQDPADQIASCDVLVDFDSDFKNDVFISSKLITYLNTNKPILSITTKGSPSDILLRSKEELGITKLYYSDPLDINVFSKLIRLNGYVDDAILTARKSFLKKYDANHIASVVKKNLQDLL